MDNMYLLKLHCWSSSLSIYKSAQPAEYLMRLFGSAANALLIYVVDGLQVRLSGCQDQV